MFCLSGAHRYEPTAEREPLEVGDPRTADGDYEGMWGLLQRRTGEISDDHDFMFVALTGECQLI
jgi:hypothetical protein